ncbi:MAG: DUF1538 domain-containing protein [Candidatus Heteroscillospira sp.]|jgi:hypothetical protein
MTQKLRDKIIESLTAVLPVTAIVLLLCVTIAPMPLAPFVLFLFGAVLLVVGMGLFNLGAELAMMPIGEKMGWQLTKCRSLKLVAVLCFVIGVMITAAEPDLQVLAGQMPSVPNLTLILAVAGGVGVFLVLAFLRSLLGLELGKILLVLYPLVFLLSFFVPGDFVAVAFDSGGVTTGPITVPFIMSLGLGLGSIGGRDKNGSGNFGLIALCSVGPILAVMLLGLIYNPESAGYTPSVIPDFSDTRSLWQYFQVQLPHYALEVVRAVTPIVAFFGVFQLLLLRLRRRHLIRIAIGLVYTFLGLTLFLTGVNAGFMPVGSYLGAQLAALPSGWVIVPIAMLIGYFIVKAEPAVVVLNKQVEDLTGGAISQHVMMTGLSLGMAISLGLAMIRVLTGLNIMYFILPGYAIALALSFFVPPLFTAIAFDSGGVASGPMTATFLLPFAIGACEAVGGNVLTDAFGVVAMVAMTPLVIIQLIGLAYRIKTGSVQMDHPAAEEEPDIVILNFFLEVPEYE